MHFHLLFYPLPLNWEYPPWPSSTLRNIYLSSLVLFHLWAYDCLILLYLHNYFWFFFNIICLILNESLLLISIFLPRLETQHHIFYFGIQYWKGCNFLLMILFQLGFPVVLWNLLLKQNPLQLLLHTLFINSSFPLFLVLPYFHYLSDYLLICHD